MTDADNTPPAGGDQAPAAGSELSIPKYRFDEVAAEVRRLREEVALKDRLYMEDRQRFSQQQQRQPEADITPEEVGLDPQTFIGVKKLAAKMAEGIVKQRETVFEQQIGILANRTEKAELLASKGADKAKYFPEALRRQQEHYQLTGTFMPLETAYELIRVKELEDKVRMYESKQTQAATTQSAQTPTQSVPSAAGTRQIPTGGTTQTAQHSQAKSFSELSVEEMEARLDEQMRQGTVI